MSTVAASGVIVRVSCSNAAMPQQKGSEMSEAPARVRSSDDPRRRDPSYQYRLPPIVPTASYNQRPFNEQYRSGPGVVLRGAGFTGCLGVPGRRSATAPGPASFARQPVDPDESVGRFAAARQSN